LKILVIRLKQIGDALISLPVCKSLRATLPDAQIDYLLYAHIAPLFLHHPAVDNVLTISPEERSNRWKYFLKMRDIRKARYDLVIDLLTVPVTALMTRYSGAPLQLGFDKGKWRSKLYKTSVPHPGAGGSLDAKLSILAGLPFEVTRVRSFEIVLKGEELSDMRARMTAHNLSPDKPTLLFSPISRLGSKNWPADFFTELINHCLSQFDVQGIMIWGPGEREDVLSLARRIDLPTQLSTSIETRSLRELAALSRLCTLFIGNDSGPRHVAEASGIPTFTIFSPPISKFAWIPHRGPRHRGVDMCDALDIDEQTWHRQVVEFRQKQDSFYRKITPEIVMERLQPMLAELMAGHRT
jgi:heptosyltransferase-2